MSWRGLDHATIYEMVVNGGKGPGMSMDVERRWEQIQETISAAEHAIAAAVRDSETEWEGAGADAMRTAYTPLGAWALNAAASAHVTATGVRGQAELAANTRRLVAVNAPPQNAGEHLHSFFGGLDGDSVYITQAAEVDRLMTDYDTFSVDNEQRFDSWSVPPTVVVSQAVAGPAGPGGAGVGPMPDTGGVAPAGGGSAITSALSPGTAGVGGGGVSAGAGAVPTGAIPAGGGSGAGPGSAGIGAVPGAGGPAAAGAGAATPGTAGPGATAPGATAPSATAPGATAPGAAGAGTGGTGTAGRGTGGSGAGAVGRGTGGPGSAAGGAAGGVGRGAAPGTTGRGPAGLGTGGFASPGQRPPGSPGGSGTGPGPWSRAATEAGRSPAAATPFRSVVPTVPPRTSVPDWRSVLLPPEREPAAATRAPGEPAARPAGPGAPGGSAPTQAAAQGSGTRAGGSPGMHAPMMGAGAGGAQPEGRRRASYLIDDSDAFVDKRWFTEPVMTPDDPL